LLPAAAENKVQQKGAWWERIAHIKQHKKKFVISKKQNDNA